MGEQLQLKAADGHKFGAYRAVPKGTPRGGIVVIQEIFGVNSHIRGLCDGFAADGYLAVAPALFDRVTPNVELGYTPDDIQNGMGLRGKMQWDTVLADTAAAIAVASEGGAVGITGYCYGGGVVWAASARLKGLSAAVGYYGGPWDELKAEAPKCASMLHFGAKDKNIPVSLADKMKTLHPFITTHVYDADHGFNCNQRGSYNAYAETLARHRTMALFAATLG